MAKAVLRVEYTENGPDSTVRLVSPNSKILMSSETYTNPANAKRAAARLAAQLNLPVVASAVRDE